MDIDLTNPSEGFSVRSYAEGLVVINQEAHTRSLILMPERVIPEWRPQRFEQLADRDFEQLANLEAEIILLGTGRTQRFPAAGLYASLITKGIGLEIMDTAAACRTYNILMSEGRRVAAALMMIEPAEHPI